MKDVLLGLKSDEKVLAAVRAAGGRTMSANERLEQRVSYVYGLMGPASEVTRERVKQLILEQDGVVQTAGK